MSSLNVSVDFSEGKSGTIKGKKAILIYSKVNLGVQWSKVEYHWSKAGVEWSRVGVSLE
jgi:hypothetical protein